MEPPDHIHTSARPLKLGSFYTMWHLKALDVYSKRYELTRPHKLHSVARCIATEQEVADDLREDEKDFLRKYRQKQCAFQILLGHKQYYQGDLPIPVCPVCPDILFFVPDQINGWSEIPIEDIPLYCFLKGTPYLEEHLNKLRSQL